MEIPLKLWMAKDTQGVWTTNPKSTRYVEYIRTDAFIEKACAWLDKNFNMPDDFKEHFKSAMKL